MRSGLRTSRPGLALQSTSCPRVCPSKLKPLRYSDVIRESGSAIGAEDAGSMHDVKEVVRRSSYLEEAGPKRTKSKANNENN